MFRSETGDARGFARFALPARGTRVADLMKEMTLTRELQLLWSAESRRILIDTRRYWLETVLGVAIMTFLFVGLFHGVGMIGGATVRESSTGSLVMGFFMWTLAVAAYGGIANDISRETTLGTVEQLVVTPHALVSVFLVRACLHLLIGLVTSVVVLVVAVAITGQSITVAGTSLLALAVGLPALFGVGLMLGAVALLAKRVTALLAVVHLVLVVLIGVGAQPFTLAGALPYAATATVTMRATVGGRAVTAAELAFLAGVSAVYLIVGVVAFGAAERRARRNNILEHY
jgi:ABC-2 type transport system permease protein